MTLIIFPEVKQTWNDFWEISLKTYTEKKTQSFTVKSLTSFSFCFFLTRKLRYNPYIIELFHLEFLM